MTINKIYQARLREYFQEKLGYGEDEEFQYHQEVTDNQAEDYINGTDHGPDLNDLHFHCIGGRTSPWNQEAIRLMTEDIIILLEEDEYEWPARPVEWWQIEMWNRFSRLIVQWNLGQRQTLSDGEDESDGALDRRLDEMRNSRLRQQRRRTRRFAVRLMVRFKFPS